MTATMLLLGACDPSSGLKPLGPVDVDGGYRLSTGDQVRLITFNEQSLSGDFTVDDSGYVAIPLLGPVHAQGLTTRELASKVAGELKARKFFVDPSIVVEVVKYRPVFVLGEVQHPGPFPYQPHMTLLSAVALAGGFTPRAVKARAEVVRPEDGGTLKGGLDPDSSVAPGDIITVLERTF